MLVFYHVVGGDPEQGLCIQDGIYRVLADGLAFARMPVFAALAGFAYSYSRQAGLVLVRKKARRLLLPTLVVGTLFAIVRELVRGSEPAEASAAWWHWMPVGHFWFLQSLFLIFLVVAVLERVWGLASVRVCFVAMLLSCCTYLLGVATPVLGISGAFYLAPFFFFGLLTARMRPQMAAWLGRGWWALLIVLAVTVTWSFSYEQRDNVFHLVSGLMVSALAMQFMPRVGVLAAAGRYSFEIFLLHVFFTAVSRSLLLSLGVSKHEVLIVAGMLSGVWGPLLVSRVCGRWVWYKVLVLGQDGTLKKDHKQEH